MKTIAAGIQADLDVGRWSDRALVLLDFASGQYGFWTDVGTYTYNGVDYVGSGALLSVEFPTGNIEASPTSCEVKISDVPTGVAATIEDETYKNRPMRVYQLYVDPDTRAPVTDPVPFWAGNIDFVRHEVQDGGNSAIVIVGESRALEQKKTGWALRNNDSQQLAFSGDTFYQNVEDAGMIEINWGPRPKKHPNARFRQRRR